MAIINDMLARLREIAAADRTSTEKLRDAIIWQVMGTVERISEMTIYYRERHHLSPPAAARIAEKRRAYESILESIIAAGMAGGSFRLADVKVTAYGIAGMCAWTYRWFQEGGRLSARQVGKLYADLVLHGLAGDTREKVT